MKTETKPQRGGARKGAGRKKAEEKRIQTPLTVLPSVLAPFRAVHGRGWSRKVENFMRREIKKSVE